MKTAVDTKDLNIIDTEDTEVMQNKKIIERKRILFEQTNRSAKFEQMIFVLITFDYRHEFLEDHHL